MTELTELRDLRRFRPYPQYRDSGIEWLGEVPIDWEVHRLKFLLQEPLQYGANEPAEMTDPNLPRYIRITDVGEDGRLRDDTFRSIPEDVARPYLLEYGDLLFARSGATVGKTFRFEPGWGKAAHAGYLIRARLKSQACSSRFVQYFTTSRGYWDWLRSNFIQATIQNVSADRYSNLEIPLPELREQLAIADFLDRKTANIDALVAKKERLIELLQEKRTALITRTVTRGLDTNVPMKNSAVEWLGEIPAHWHLRPLKRVSPEVTVGVVVNPSTYVRTDGVPFLYGSDIREGRIVADTARRMSEEDSRSLSKSRLRAGDLVCVRVGAPGVTAVVPPELQGANCASVLIVRHAGTFDSQWLCYAMNSRLVRHQVALVQYGAAQEQFNVAHAVEFVVPLAPQPEQRDIAVFLDHETAKIDALVAKVHEAIDNLNEFRTALISAAVTGKIDVREAVPL